jgi:SAM-dependent methyltransferase
MGIDLCWSFLRFGRHRSPGLPLVRADLHDLPFRCQSFQAVWAAASLIHLSKSAMAPFLRNVMHLVPPGGLLAATLLHGCHSGPLRQGWIPGRFIARWKKAELAQIVEAAGWEIISLATVANRERKGRWLNLIAHRPASAVKTRIQPSVGAESNLGEPRPRKGRQEKRFSGRTPKENSRGA